MCLKNYYITKIKLYFFDILDILNTRFNVLAL